MGILHQQLLLTMLSAIILRPTGAFFWRCMSIASSCFLLLLLELSAMDEDMPKRSKLSSSSFG